MPPGPQLPPGGSLPPDGDFADSPLLAALAASLGPDPTDLNVGPQDPQMGLEDLLHMLGLADAGLGGADQGPPGGMPPGALPPGMGMGRPPLPGAPAPAGMMSGY
jgi:hypothetical protein